MKLHRRFGPVLPTLVLALFAVSGFAADAKKPAKKDAKKAEAKTDALGRPKPQYDDVILNSMDHGPFYSGVFNGRDLSLKGIAIKLDGGKAGIVFDTLTLRYGDGWTGGFIQINGERTLGCNSTPVGDLAFSTHPGPGWAKGGAFDAPRPRYESTPGHDKKHDVAAHKGICDGPLPREWAKWKGIYRNGESVVLTYSVGTADVLDLPGLENRDGLALFTRTLHVSKSSEPLIALIAEDASATAKTDNGIVTLTTTNGTVAIGVKRSKASKGVKLSVADHGRVLLTIENTPRAHTVQVVIAKLADSNTAKFSAALKSYSRMPELAKLIQPGAPIWPQTVTLKGTVPLSSEPYVSDTIPVPDLDLNPWKSWIRCSGFDFFSDGRLAICSLSGDVWIVSGLDAKLDKVTWKRFASGLYQPLGLKIVKDQVFVLGRDQLTKLHDLNHDGEADFYENFNNDVAISEYYHEFCLNLETDSKGNFYFTKGGNLGPATHPHHGCLLRIAADGSKLDVVATGLRAPNGMGMGLHDEVSTADNEGNWVPVCRVDLAKPGAFLGHVFTAHRDQPPANYGNPLFWIAYNQDNSSGGQVWVNNDQWGPFNGDMLHMSYGKCALFKTWKQDVGDVVQGGYVRFPLTFDSGVMRGRFSPFDHQLYTCGLSVWQSSGARKGGFYRVRYTGRPVVMPTQLVVKKNGVEITFTGPLDPETAKDTGSYAVDQWNYKWAQDYGSKLYSVKDPTKALDKSLERASGDEVQVKSAKLSNGNKTVFLEFGEPVVPVMEQHVRFNLNDANGKPLKVTELFHTINRVPAN
ncbi:MAG: hypothetical protein HY301_11590 [Verrucomicrobia bacterium]|nr:hypothetical protein [Verrucomicrobiota bacterium]